MVARVKDPSFAHHFQGTLGLVHALLVGVGPMIGWLELLQMIDQQVEASMDALLEGALDLLGSPPPEKKERASAQPPKPRFGRSAPDGAQTLPILSAARAYAAREIRSALEGFGRVCREVADLDPDAVIAVFAPFLTEHLAPFQALMGQAEPDPDAIGVCVEAFAAVWEVWLK